MQEANNLNKLYTYSEANTLAQVSLAPKLMPFTTAEQNLWASALVQMVTHSYWWPSKGLLNEWVSSWLPDSPRVAGNFHSQEGPKQGFHMTSHRSFAHSKLSVSELLQQYSKPVNTPRQLSDQRLTYSLQKLTLSLIQKDFLEQKMKLLCRK